MAMFMAQEDFCGWCTREDATYECSCGRIRFCGRDCQKAAWSEHRLVCTAARPDSSNDYYPGDVVRIHGLQSSSGQQINDRLGEVQKTLNNERVQVIVTAPNFKIKTVAIKPVNLTMHLSAREAASRAADLEEKQEAMSSPNELRSFFESCIRVAQTIPSLSGAEIVRRIDQGDRELLQALLLPPSVTAGHVPELPAVQQEQMYDSGLAEVCLGKLKFPESIDANVEQEQEQEQLPTVQVLNILGNVLNKGEWGPNKERKLNEARVQVARKLGPAIMACATKKRRLNGRTEHWFGVQRTIFALLVNCMIAEGAVSRVLLQELDEAVREALMGHIILLLTVDPTRYLQPNTPMANSLSQGGGLHGNTLCKAGALSVLVELVDISSVGEEFVRSVGEHTVPAGSPGLTGRKFAECYLDCAAMLVLEVLPSEFGPRNVVHELHYVYGCLIQSPRLRYLLGDIAEDFIAADSVPKMLRWATERRKSSS